MVGVERVYEQIRVQKVMALENMAAWMGHMHRSVDPFFVFLFFLFCARSSVLDIALILLSREYGKKGNLHVKSLFSSLLCGGFITDCIYIEREIRGFHGDDGGSEWNMKKLAHLFSEMTLTRYYDIIDNSRLGNLTNA